MSSVYHNPSGCNNLLECCLFFTANSLARVITRMGEEEFAVLGMSPSYAFSLSLVVDSPEISQKELPPPQHGAINGFPFCRYTGETNTSRKVTTHGVSDLA